MPGDHQSESAGLRFQTGMKPHFPSHEAVALEHTGCFGKLSSTATCNGDRLDLLLKRTDVLRSLDAQKCLYAIKHVRQWLRRRQPPPAARAQLRSRREN